MRKPGIGEIAKAFRGIVPGPHRLTAPHMNPQLQGPKCQRTLGYSLRP